jgi:glucosylceramidase
MDRLLDGGVGTPNMHRVMSQLDSFNVSSDHLVFGSEACHCPTTGYAGGDINVAWARAERYAHAILADLAAGSQGWVEWNLILDSIGGPNHLGNLCDASLLAVPHRAIGSDAPHTMPWEHTDHSSRFGRNVGDDRTREELNALGFPAELLDFGIVAQPLFYYMGHLSRHVRPGSRAVPAYVNGTSAIFRLENLVAGGGMNDLARQGIELTVWPCEGSTRQQFYLKENHIQVLGHDWLGNPTKSCVGRHNSKDFLGIVTGPCTRSFAGKFDIVPIPDEPSYSNIFLLNGNKSAEEFCLVVQELENGGGANGLRSGSQVSAGTCPSEEAKWRYNIQTGEITSSYFEGGDVCMTTGWPFLQVGAFDTPNADNKKAIIVLNEAAQRANYIVKDGEKILLSGAIPAHSIQTILVD